MTRWLLVLTLVSSLGIAGLISFVKSKDVGSSLPVKNFPVGWIYVEYPAIVIETNNLGAGVYVEFNSSPCSTDMGMNGRWVLIEDFNGEFFRTEGGFAKDFLPSGNTSQQQAIKTHWNDHQHQHTHKPKPHGHGNHNHPHEHQYSIEIRHESPGDMDSDRLHFITNPGIVQYPTDFMGKTFSDIIDEGEHGTPVSTAGTILVGDIDISSYVYEKDEEIEDNETHPDNYVYRLWEKTEDSVNCRLEEYEMHETNIGNQRKVINGKFQTRELVSQDKIPSKFKYEFTDELDTEVILK